MADTNAGGDSAAATVSAAATPKKGSKGSANKKARAKPAHPRTSEMVSAAIKNLKERGGSSLQAIKKYISATYKVDAEKMAPFIKKYLKGAVASGELVQTKGKGASGSFKLPTSGKPEKAAPAKKAKPAAAKERKVPKAGAKKVGVKQQRKSGTAGRKPAAEKKKATAPKPKKSPSKAKKAAKVPTKKPKAPKPKKAAVSAKAKSTPKKKK